MTVIPGHRTQELYLIKLCPGRTSHESMRHGTGHRIKHDVQTGIPIYNNTALRHLRHIRKKLSRITDPVKNPVIAAVHAVRA